jgi:hypothetical protein
MPHKNSSPKSVKIQLSRLKSMTSAGKHEDGTIGVSTDHETPHQKELSGSIGTEKAAGMGKVIKIGVMKSG